MSVEIRPEPAWFFEWYRILYQSTGARALA